MDFALIILSVAVGLAGVGVTAWGLWGDRARGRRRCGECWYSLEGIGGLRCPECGREGRSERDLLRTRRRWGRAAAGLALAGVSGGTMLLPGAIRDGWPAAVPAAAWRVVMPVVDPAPATLAFEWLWEHEGARGPRDHWARVLSAHRARTVLERTLAAARKRGGAKVEGGEAEWDGAPESVAVSAMEIVEQLGSEARIALPTVRALVRDRRVARELRVAGVWALAAAEPGGRVIGSLSAVALHEPDTELRMEAMTVIARARPATRRQVEIIAAGLRDGDAMTRRWAAELLGEMGVEATIALAALRECAAKEGNEGVIEAVVEAIGRIQGEG